MQRITPLTTDHQLILECLEVLRLIVERMQSDETVDPADIATVLAFMRDVACECLDHTQELLLRPALLRAKNKNHVQHLKAAVARHHTVRPALEDTAAVTTSRKHFVLHAHLLTKVVSDLIIEEDESLLDQAVELLCDEEGRRNIERFIEKEREISALAVERGRLLHRLEAKYAYPQCI
jgi:hemerythrin-like domain-containing protein